MAGAGNKKRLPIKSSTGIMGARNAVGGSIEPSQSVQNPIPFCAIWVAHNIDIGSLD